jgi:hypothetical protein
VKRCDFKFEEKCKRNEIEDTLKTWRKSKFRIDIFLLHLSSSSSSSPFKESRNFNLSTSVECKHKITQRSNLRHNPINYQISSVQSLVFLCVIFIIYFCFIFHTSQSIKETTITLMMKRIETMNHLCRSTNEFIDTSHRLFSSLFFLLTEMIFERVEKEKTTTRNRSEANKCSYWNWKER